MDADTYKQSGGDVEHLGMISAKGMALQKRVFPVACVIGLVTMIVLFRYARPADTILLVALIVVVIVGDVLICASVFRQADEVRDGGDHLVVTKSDQEVRIPLRQVSKVTAGLLGSDIASGAAGRVRLDHHLQPAAGTGTRRGRHVVTEPDSIREPAKLKYQPARRRPRFTTSGRE